MDKKPIDVDPVQRILSRVPDRTLATNIARWYNTTNRIKHLDFLLRRSLLPLHSIAPAACSSRLIAYIPASFCQEVAWGQSTQSNDWPGGWNGFMLALIATLWAYDGWSDLTMVPGEVRRPGRNLPLALIGGLLGVAVLYMATNAAIQYVLPAQAIAASEWPAVAALRMVAGTHGAGIVAAAMALSILAALNGTVMSGARVPYAASLDGLFFRRFGRVHPHFRSPSTSLVSTVLLMFLGPF
jgi:amino acid transporter